MLRILVSLQVLALSAGERLRANLARDDGQSTAEYALVLLGAAGVAAVLVTWALKSGKISGLLDFVLDRVMDKAS